MDQRVKIPYTPFFDLPTLPLTSESRVDPDPRYNYTLCVDSLLHNLLNTRQQTDKYLP